MEKHYAPGLLTGDLRDPVRSWVDEEIALARMKEEVWTLTGPHPRWLPLIKSRQRGRGYAMMRVVH